MFFNHQSDEEKSEYTKLLALVGSLSRLYSDSEIPALYYRVAERAFCRAFGAVDLSRSDVAIDAQKARIGIGLKTFLRGNNRTFQKIAEFNKDREMYTDLAPDALVHKIAELRNERIDFVERAYGVDAPYYHCVLRSEHSYTIYEEPLDRIDTGNIADVSLGKNTIRFHDGRHEYSFLLTKSTLTKRFVTQNTLCDMEVSLLEDPFDEPNALLCEGSSIYADKPIFLDTVYLPLYSTRDGEVPEKSGLNQWNAAGRERNLSEVYIPIPREVHTHKASFFPDRDTSFILKIPGGKEIQAKVCQSGGKALMSHSNRELGQWILRDVFHLAEGELLTSQKMQTIGIDSVRVDKISNSVFEVSFAQTGSYERFRNTFT